MEAFYYVDKPTGQTSFQVLRDMRRILWVKKIGHTGTLDPLATWGLLVATWNYTKLISYVEKDSKSYRAEIMLDGTSPSYDSDSEISYLADDQQSRLKNNLTQEDIQKMLDSDFSGEITQIPPKYSALKIDGKRALDRTLAWEEVIMKERKATILSSKIISFEYPKLVADFTVTAGTYIRSIAFDLWEKLWAGWYLCNLRRTWVGKLSEDMLQSLDDISTDNPLKVELIFWDKIFHFDDEVVLRRLSDGQRVWGEYDFPENENIFLSDGNMIRYVVEYKDSVLHPRKKIV